MKKILFVLMSVVLCFAASAQNVTNDNVLTGTVTSSKLKDPLVGVQVFVPGTSVGTVTDIDGKYELNIKGLKKPEIHYAFLGMETRIIKYSGELVLDVTLTDDVESLDDVIVTGYANIRKEGFTGNTTRVTSDQLISISPKSIIDAVQVFDPSFRIAENIAMGSDPNSMPEFYIRGQNSINMEISTTADISRQNLESNNNLPIFILDGFEVDVEKIYDMDPTRIHSLTLLKDAAATALYGSRAANGVVVIESRAPESGKIRVSYNLNLGVEVPDLSGYNLMNAREKVDAELAAGLYDLNTDPSDKDITDKVSYKYYLAKENNISRGVDTYWLSQNLRTAFNHKHSLYLDGGQDDIRWGVELKYNGSDGVMIGTDRETYGAGIVLDYRIGRFQLLNRTDMDIMEANNSPFQTFSTYAHLQPYDVITDPITGRASRELGYWGAGSSPLNPMYEINNMQSYDTDKYVDFANKLSLNYFATKNLTAKVQFALNKKYSDNERFLDPASVAFRNEKDPTRLGSLYVQENESFSYNLNALLLYNKSIKKHYINATVGAELSERNYVSQVGNYTGFASGALSSINYAAKMLQKPSRSSNKTRLASFLAIANYSYNDIYIADASVRLDGSSEFGGDNKTAPFWAAGAGINFHNYDFLKNNSAISRLKIRASYGQIGKVNFPMYAAKSSYSLTSSTDWYLTGMGNMLTYLGNDDLTWEKTNSLDVGIELGFMDDKLAIKANYYDKTTVDMITSVTLPSSSGFTSYMDNMGKVKNNGFEVDIRYNFYKSKDLEFTIFGNISHNKNEILEISDALKAYNELVDDIYADYGKGSRDTKYSKPNPKFVEGGSLTSIFGMKSLGINPANGREIYELPDGRGITYDWNAADQVIIGNTEPMAQGSFGLNARYKNFSLFTSFMFRFGGQQYNSTLANYVENVDLLKSNADKRVGTDAWVKPGDIAAYRDIANSSYTTRPTSRFVQNDNTLSFNSLSLSYDFNQELIKKAGFGMIRLTANMQDLGYWSSILRERGLEYPFARTFSFSLNLTF